MNREDIVRLTSLADTVKQSQESARVIPIRKIEPPKHAHLLRVPASLIEQAVAYARNEGEIGDALPWEKTHKNFRLRPNEITVWGGKNGARKSTLLSEILLSLASRDCRVVIISLEMPAHKLASRMIAQAFARRDFSYDEAIAWAEDIGESLCFLDYTGEMHWQEVVKFIRYCADEFKTQHILLDNLTKFVGVDNDRAEELRQFTAAAHRAAIETGIHVHVVAHTRKAMTANEHAMPSRYDIAGSRTLIDQVDNVVLVWRNHQKELKAGEFNVDHEPDVRVRVDKQRFGRWEGEFSLYVNPECFRFVSARGEIAAPFVRQLRQ